MVGRWFKTENVTKKQEQKWTMIRNKYEKELKNVRAKARRMKALKAKPCMKAMKAKAKQCKKARK